MCVFLNIVRWKCCFIDAYGFQKQSIDVLYSYLTTCKQRTKVNSAYRSWEMLLSGVPQGSINRTTAIQYIYIYISDMFLETPKDIDFAGYADDNTPYTCSSNIEKVLENLQGALEQLYQWFPPNHLVANAGKCHLLTSFKITNNIAISNTNVSSEQKVKLLGINLERRLNFDYHVNTLLNKANKKYHASARLCNYMNTNKRQVLMKAFIKS